MLAGEAREAHTPVSPHSPSLIDCSIEITVPALQHPTKLQCPPFELIFGDFAPALLEVSFGMILHNSLRTNHREKMFRKEVLRWYLVQH